MPDLLNTRHKPVRAPVVCRLAVIWIDWYAYHVARFCGLDAEPAFKGAVAGIELVGGIGVHTGLKFRENIPEDLPVETLLPESNWHDASKFTLALRLWRKLDSLDPDTVLVPGYYTVPAIAAALWAKLHRRCSVLMTESAEEDHPRSRWTEIIKALLIRSLFDRAVAGGSAHRRYLKQLAFPPERVFGCYDVVDNESFRKRTGELSGRVPADFDLPGKYFLYIGRLAPEKNVAALLRVWIAYRRQGGTWPLVLVGDGPDSLALKEAAEASPFASEVHFAGHRGSDQLPVFYAFAGCFILPSTREPWGLVVNEAMACGLPVLVSSRCGCSEDLVANGSNGFVFDPYNDAALLLLLQRIGAARPEELERMGRASRDRINEYSPRHFGAQVARLAAS